MIPGRLRELVVAPLRRLRLAQHIHARWRHREYDRSIERFVREKTGIADRRPAGVVYEATMRCNLKCEFCYVGDLLNLEGEWRQELTVEALRKAFPEKKGLSVSLTGGEVFVRKDVEQVLDLFREKGYACGYLTTNGTAITEARAAALADLALAGFVKHISVSIDGPGELHDAARGVKGTFERTAAGLRRLQAAARAKGAPLKVSINTTVTRESLRRARPDGGGGDRARRGRDRPEPPDVRHARRSGTDAQDPRRDRSPAHRDLRDGGPWAAPGKRVGEESRRSRRRAASSGSGSTTGRRCTSS